MSAIHGRVVVIASLLIGGLAGCGAASSPATSASPASASPASVSPASVSPASVSPASASPASASPASAAVLYLQTSDYVPFAGQTVTLTVSAAAGGGQAPWLRVASTTISFGDGAASSVTQSCAGSAPAAPASASTASASTASASGLAVRHVYHRAGLLTAQVTAARICGVAGQPDLSYVTAAMQVLPAAPPASASWPRCAPDQLRVTEGQPGFATGHAGVEFTLHNVSSVSCQLLGYPGLQLIGRTGAALPTTAEHEVANGYLFPAVTPARVALPPGGYASFDLEYGDNPFGARASEPYAQACPAASAVAITLPGGGAVTVPASLAPCSGLVLLSPVIPGSAVLRYPP